MNPKARAWVQGKRPVEAGVRLGPWTEDKPRVVVLKREDRGTRRSSEILNAARRLSSRGSFCASPPTTSPRPPRRGLERRP